MSKQFDWQRLQQAKQKAQEHLEGQRKNPEQGSSGETLAERRIREALAQGAFDNLEGQGQPLDPNNVGANTEGKRASLTSANAISLADQRIQAAIERGEFDNLAGAGKPLNLDEDLFVPEELRMAFRLLKGNGYAPIWIEVRRELQEQQRKLATIQQQLRSRWGSMSLAERDVAQGQIRETVAQINSGILSYNLTAPSEAVHLTPLVLEDELRKTLIVDR